MTKILLVDDSKFLRLTAERALARAGYEVSSATDGEKALRMAREELPDLILMDILLPKMSGRDVLLALKKTRDQGDSGGGDDGPVSEECGPVTGRWSHRVLGKIRSRFG